jgi:hypothetical protein
MIVMIIMNFYDSLRPFTTLFILDPPGKLIFGSFPWTLYSSLLQLFLLLSDPFHLVPLLTPQYTPSPFHLTDPNGALFKSDPYPLRLLPFSPRCLLTPTRSRLRRSISIPQTLGAIGTNSFTTPTSITLLCSLSEEISFNRS